MYKILITREEVKEVWIPKTWEILAEEILTPEEETEGKVPRRNQGYTPQEMQNATVTVKVLEQEVEELDLAAVIAAVNGLQLA